MPALVVLVEFIVAETAVEAFRPLMAANAEASLREEPDCLQFDVACDAARPERFVLYEIYRSDAAFAHHLATPHFKAFDAATAGMITARKVERLRLFHPAAPAPRILEPIDATNGGSS